MLIQAAGSQAPRQQAQAEGLTLRVAENTTVMRFAAIISLIYQADTVVVWSRRSRRA